ncbi:hypothetical protein VHEMI03052 [[Torrubiella] hemipterigena]|uniref:Major facilitator superfamily (MFS) profile domain-containing protein n=1 Tax=[Torrubiella] hemipterigena TaxID=1531966 RepID=A0A0A1SRD9_9HYPO|nr:hypothetical protein VHEMI03052 [[Torrubiella] hemipterigena]
MQCRRGFDNRIPRIFVAKAAQYQPRQESGSTGKQQTHSIVAMSPPTESSPLLQHEAESAEEAAPPLRPKGSWLRWPKVTNPQAINGMQMFVIFTLTFSALLASVPQLQLLEGAICKEYYAARSPLEADEPRPCKIPAVEARLARLTGISSTLGIAAELVMALPMGRLADRIGKRPIMIWAVVSYMLTSMWTSGVLWFSDRLPVSLILGNFVPLLLGGGETVLVSMLFAMTAEIAPSALRANYFLQLSVGSFLGQSLASLVSSVLLIKGYTWLPILLSYIIPPIGLSILVFYPEKRRLPHQQETPADEPSPGDKVTLKHRFTAAVRAAGSTVSIISSPSAAFIMFSFLLVSPVTMCVATLLLLLVRMRFHWSFAQAGLLLSIRGFGNIFVSLVFIPIITKILMSDRFRFRYSTAQKDLSLAKVFVLLLTVGTALVTVPAIPGVITGVIIVTFGYGWLAMCRSLMVVFIDESQLSQLYSLISMVEAIGTLLAQPILSGLFSIGLELGPPWEILPFTVTTLLCLLAACLLFFVRLPTLGSGNLV